VGPLRINEGRLGIVAVALSCWPGAYSTVGFLAPSAPVGAVVWAESEGEVAVEEGSDEIKAIFIIYFWFVEKIVRILYETSSNIKKRKKKNLLNIKVGIYI
jgi:hypothetical protein